MGRLGDRRKRAWEFVGAVETTGTRTTPLLGRLAVERRHITLEQLDICLEIQDQARLSGEPLNLGQILLKQKLIDTRTLSQLLQEQRRQLDGIPNIPRYEIQERLGEGGMAVVYRARDRELRRSVAVKLLEIRGRFPDEIRKRFVREAQSMANLSHPNVVTLHDMGTADGRPFLVMELMEGKSFADLLRERSAGRRALVGLLEKAARGVAAAHRKGIVHRDLKPGNILITSGGEPKVTDFGLAYWMGSQTAMTGTGERLGTPLYMAPEQVRGTKVTPATDVYALGALLYEVLSGDPPHTGDSIEEVFARIVDADPVPPRRRRRDVPRELQVICLKALAKEPARRYPTANEFAEDLARYLEGETILARPPSLSYRISKFVAKRKALMAMATVALLVTGGLTALLLPKWLEAGALERARPHLQSGREILSNLDRLLTTEYASRKKVDGLARRARESFTRALKQYPDHPEALLETARAYWMEGRREEAMDYCTRAIQASPTYGSAYLDRALLRLREYQHKSVDHRGHLTKKTKETSDLRRGIEEDLHQARRLLGDRPEFRFAEGVMLVAELKHEEAAAKLREFVASSVADPRGWFWLGQALNNVDGKLEEAVQALTKALEYRPRDVPALVQRGIAFGKMGKLDEAIRDFDRVIEIHPHMMAYNNRAMTHRLKGDRHQRDDERAAAKEEWRLAEKDFAEALRLKPDSLAVRLNRGALRFSTGDRKGAREDFEKLIRLDPDYVAAQYSLAGLELQEGNLEEAIKKYDKVLELDADYVDAYMSRGGAKFQQRHFDGGMADFRTVVQLKPRLARAHHNLGYGHKMKGDMHAARGKRREAMEEWKRAGKAFDEAIRLKTDYLEAIFMRGRVNLALGKLGQAEKDFTRVTKLRPKWGTPY